MAVISKGIKLSYVDLEIEDYVILTNLQEIPELGGDTEAIDITTFDDSAHMYTDGIRNYGDTISFKFLYEKTQFEKLQKMGKSFWQLDIPSEVSCTFQATPSIKLDGVGVNNVLTYTLNLKLQSQITWCYYKTIPIG